MGKGQWLACTVGVSSSGGASDIMTRPALTACSPVASLHHTRTVRGHPHSTPSPVHHHEYHVAEQLALQHGHQVRTDGAGERLGAQSGDDLAVGPGDEGGELCQRWSAVRGVVTSRRCVLVYAARRDGQLHGSYAEQHHSNHTMQCKQPCASSLTWAGTRCERRGPPRGGGGWGRTLP